MFFENETTFSILVFISLGEEFYSHFSRFFKEGLSWALPITNLQGQSIKARFFIRFFKAFPNTI